MTVLLFSLGVFAQENTVLIAHNNYLVGATRGGKWLKDTEVPNEFGKPSKFIGFDSFKSGEKPSKIYGTLGQLGCSANLFYFNESAKVPENIFDETSLKPILAISSNAKWNPLPRVAQKIALTNKTYRKIALDFLKTKIRTAKSVKLENAFSVDLEGDGTDEVFLEATNYKDKNGEISATAHAGNYSFVLMRKIGGGKPKDFLIEGEFHPKKPEIEDYISEFDLSAIADLNGDGKMEVVLSGLYSYGGVSTEIYESDKTKLNEVLSVECGD
jgi:hypothetical protein